MEIPTCKRNMNWLPLARSPTGHWACNPGTHPGGELNQPPSPSQEDARPSEPHQSGQLAFCFIRRINCFPSITGTFEKAFIFFSHLKVIIK